MGDFKPSLCYTILFLYNEYNRIVLFAAQWHQIDEFISFSSTGTCEAV